MKLTARDPATDTYARAHLPPWLRNALTERGDCWVWTKSRTKDGYAQVRARRDGYDGWAEGSPVKKAHRVAYEILVRPLDPAEELGNDCGDRACCYPVHWTLRPMGHTGRMASPQTPPSVDGDAAARMLAEGLSPHAIAQRLSVGPQSVYRALRRAGIRFYGPDANAPLTPRRRRVVADPR